MLIRLDQGLGGVFNDRDHGGVLDPAALAPHLARPRKGEGGGGRRRPGAGQHEQARRRGGS
jgi:hypothetical protein